MAKPIFLFLLSLFFSVGSVFASEGQAPEGLLNKLLAPGQLIEGHKDLEQSRCLECHVPREGIPNSKCLECHKPIRAQVEKKSGFHGLATQACISCHSDHKGRNFDTTQVDSKKFDHKLTGYILEGKHADLKCSDCHKEKRAERTHYFGLKVSCVSCHQKNDPHQFQGDWAKKDCNACHQLKAWKENVRFDHKKDAHFQLEGKHAQIGCKDCHLPENSKHAIYHWEHFEKTSCLACHKNNPHHFGTFKSPRLKNPNDCSTCHLETGWKDTPKFSHNEQTRFKIGGKHLDLKCDKCHTPISGSKNPKDQGPRIYHWEKLSQITCAVCHHNPHTKTFAPNLLKKQCTECHNDRSWTEFKKTGINFDHASTRFALTGKHESLSCEACHRINEKPVFKFKNQTLNFCVDCHKNVHLGQMSSSTTTQACSQCHSTQTFEKRLEFDHSKTQYPLKWKHANVDCIKCHLPTLDKFSEKPFRTKSRFQFPTLRTQDCAACHKDPHEARYGKLCLSCHTEQGWKSGNTDFHKAFTLQGVHFTFQCGECHLDKRPLAGQSQMCVLCHKKDDVHQGRLGECSKCHEQTFWEMPRFRHSMTSFPLRGIHRTLDCNACHSTGIYRGLTNQCVNCHLNDALSFTGNPDHHLLMGRNCSDCHNQFSFH
ncbi:hypothetical protein WDW86_06440 [Bdellovibrionota bacterium FG-2]